MEFIEVCLQGNPMGFIECSGIAKSFEMTLLAIARARLAVGFIVHR